MGEQAQDKLTAKVGRGDRDPGADKPAISPPDRDERPKSDEANVKAKAKRFVPL